MSPTQGVSTLVLQKQVPSQSVIFSTPSPKTIPSFSPFNMSFAFSISIGSPTTSTLVMVTLGHPLGYPVTRKEEIPHNILEAHFSNVKQTGLAKAHKMKDRKDKQPTNTSIISLYDEKNRVFTIISRVPNVY